MDMVKNDYIYGEIKHIKKKKKSHLTLQKWLCTHDFLEREGKKKKEEKKEDKKAFCRIKPWSIG